MTEKGKDSHVKGEPVNEEEKEDKICENSQEYLESLTQHIYTQKHIYQCVDCLIYPTNNIDDEYVIIVLEIMDEKLKKFYGGNYLIQQWVKKKKIFQVVHTGKPNQFFLNTQRFIYSLQGAEEECSWMYITNIFQQIYQKIRHPLFSKDNLNNIHDYSVYVDPKQVLVTLQDKIMWTQFKIEQIMALRSAQSPKEKANENQIIEEEVEQELVVHESQVEFFDVIENCDPDDRPKDIVRIFDINNEGFSRKEVHICIERVEHISIYQLSQSKSGNSITFNLQSIFEFPKKRIKIENPFEKLQKITMENIADTENIITIHRENGEIKVINEKILKMMDDFDSNQKSQEEDEDDEPPPPPPPRNAFQRFLAYFQRNNDQAPIPRQGSKLLQPEKSQALALMGRRFTSGEPLNKIDKYFNRRSLLYFKMMNGDMKKIKIEDLKSFDPLSRASKLQLQYQEALLQDVAMHVSFFRDFLIANTTLIICHGKILSILDFQTNTWDHLLPKEQQVSVDTNVGQSYFGQPGSEIDQLLLNHIYSNTIYDCIIKYQGLFIRRLKYYNDLNKTYFEKGKLLDNFNVIQIIKNQGSKNYRLYGEIVERTFFLVEDQKTGIQSIWSSHNGSKITKLIDSIKDKWKIMEIPNAPSDMLPIYSLLSRTLTIYTLKNMKKLYRPAELLPLKTYEIKNFIQFDPNGQTQYFYFDNKLYYNHLGNIMIINLAAKNPMKSTVEISFDQQILNMYMTDASSVYYKDKKKVFRLANLEMQKQFNQHTQPTMIFNCNGTFLNKIDYGPTLGRLGIFNSPFDISIIPCLDKCRIDMIASQEFEHNFVCYKEEKNKLYAIKKPNMLITWNMDNGAVVHSQILKGIDYDDYRKHSEWNGVTVLKQRKDVKMESAEGEDDDKALKDEEDDKMSVHSNELGNADAIVGFMKAKLGATNEDEDKKHQFVVVEIKSEKEVEEHCQFSYEFQLGLNIYVSLPYVLVMDENSTQMFSLDGPTKKKTLKPLKKFFEPQMKVGAPIYFSPNFIHRLFIDPNSKKVMINHALTNKNIIAFDIKKQLMFQKKKTHPMIYFHDNEQIAITTHNGIEKIFKIVKIEGGWFSKARIELQEQSNCYYDEQSFLRRFMMDPLNFNHAFGTQMSKINLMKFRADILQRHLKLNVYKMANLDEKQENISRFYSDKNISQFNHFIIDNYRRDMTFNYLSWRVIEEIGKKKISLKDLSKEYIEELVFTILPNHKTVFHYLQNNYEALTYLIEFIQKDPDQMEEKTLTISDIPFIPDIKGITALHESLEQNNASMTDSLIVALKDACFDHHCKYIITIYNELLESVPSSMCKYLDSRLIITPWVAEFTRGRVEPLPDCNFVMNTFQLWDTNLKTNLKERLLECADTNEQPLNVYIFDIPDQHKYLKDNADNLMEALANTEELDIFQSTTVRAIIEMKWPLVKKGIIKKIFIPYTFFILSFLIYSTYIFESITQQNELAEVVVDIPAVVDPTVTTDPVSLFQFYPQFHPYTFSTEGHPRLVSNRSVSLLRVAGDESTKIEEESDWRNSEAMQFLVKSQKQIFKIVILALAGYFLLLEFRQFVVVGPGTYLRTPWNYIDLIPLALISTAMLFEYIVEVDPRFERPLNAISCFFMWVKFLYLLRIFRQTSKFISMIEAVIFDIKDFMVVFFITLCGFSQGMYILSNANADYTKTEADYDEKNPNPQFIFSFFDSIFFAYRMSLGDFDTGNLGDVFRWMALIFFVLATMFLTIVMLNLLIAVISGTYERVRDTSISQLYKTMADLTVENEYLVPDSALENHDKQGDYLYLAILDANEDDSKTTEGQLEEVRKMILLKSQAVENGLKDYTSKLISQVSNSTEKYLTLFTESNLKNELRIKQCLRKIEGQESPDQKIRLAQFSSPGSRKGSQSDVFETGRSPDNVKKQKTGK